MLTRVQFVRLLSVTLMSGLVMSSATAEIEAVKGKRYTLTKQHGPWMVMVAALRDIEEVDRKINGGMSAWEAADEIVFELRKKGIPAYTYSQDEKTESLSTVDSGRRYIAQHGYISVLAANFKSNDDPDLRKVLDYVKKKFNPSFLSDEKNGGIMPKTRKLPFSHAFLTVNPLWEGEIRDDAAQRFLIDLNAGQKFSLLQNKAKYTLVIATFQGGSVMQVGNSVSSEAMVDFDRHFGKYLDACAEDAMELVEKMRNAKKFGYERNYDAWVFHDKYKSVVTIGSFNSKDDPQIKALATQFSAKTVRHPQTGNDVSAAEFFTIPRLTRANQTPEKQWVFDPNPKIMEIPRVR
jgi:hypothetical protein